MKNENNKNKEIRKEVIIYNSEEEIQCLIANCCNYQKHFHLIWNFFRLWIVYFSDSSPVIYEQLAFFVVNLSALNFMIYISGPHREHHNIVNFSNDP